jgi:hypothetical protein
MWGGRLALAAGAAAMVLATVVNWRAADPEPEGVTVQRKADRIAK